MTADAVVLHGHAYQPPRADPRTGAVPVEPSAHPYHDWNERITAECYRPNAFARIYDDRGRIVRIVNNYERMSFDLGPTLARWLAVHAPDVHDRFVDGDRIGRTAIAHPFHHSILPLSPIEDARTELIWGIADFEHRFGRRPEGIWFPETGLDEHVVELLPALGISFTVVAPYQVRPMVPAGRAGRWITAGGGTVDFVSYDGPVSHDLAFGNLLADTKALIDRLAGSAESGLVVAATDAETFGHHHRFTERGVAHALFDVVEAWGLSTGGLAPLLDGIERVELETIPPSAWSCAHGLGRWGGDCGCSTDGGPGWHQRWRGPLREALTVLRDHAVETFVRRGADLFHDPMAARDAYGAVLADPAGWEAFVVDQVRPGADERLAALLLESQEATLASFTSCAWFFADVARREVVIVLQEAARSAELLRSIGEEPPVETALTLLETAVGNLSEVSNGRQVWEHAMTGDGTLPHERAISDAAPSFPAPSSLSTLLLELVERAIDGSDAAANQATELIDVAARSGTLLPLEHAQERMWLASVDGDWPAGLVGLAAMLGFAVDA